MKHLRRPIVAIFLLFAMIFGQAGLTPAGRVVAARPTAAEPGAGNPLLQYTAGGHVLGFQKDGLLVASTSHVLRLTFDGARPVTPLAAAGAAAGAAPGKPLEQVTWRGVWPGIDVAVTPDAAGIARATFTLAAGAPLERLRLRFNTPARVDANGALALHFAQGEMTLPAPAAWQVIDGQRVPVGVAYRLTDPGDPAAGLAGFSAAAYDPAYPLVIAPVIEWNTFLGAVENDVTFAVAVDGSGNIFVAGYSLVSWGSPVRAYSGGYDGFVARLNPSGALQWNTFLGGKGNDQLYSIGLDPSGNIYVGGLSDAAWGSPIRSFAGALDGSIAKLNASGALLWNTFLGSVTSEQVSGIAVDGSGNVYATGVGSFTWGSPVAPPAGNYDAFVARLNTNGALQWNTFLGSAGVDEGKAIALTGANKLIVAGKSQAAWGAAPKRAYSAAEDAFVAQLNIDSGALEWHTFLGGYQDDAATAVRVDASGNIYVAGVSNASWENPARTYSGNKDAFVAKLNASGALVWNSFMGSETEDSAAGVALDGSGNVYVTGFSTRSWGAPLQAFAGWTDGFAARLNPISGELTWHTFLGSNASDSGAAIAVDSSSNLIVAGDSGDNWGAPLRAYRGGTDGFTVKLNASGARLWNTFQGGSADDIVQSLVVDLDGSTCVTGYSNHGWGNPVRAYSLGNDAFVARFNPQGALVWNTFLGSPGEDYGTAIGMDDNGRLYVTGSSNATWGSPLRPYSAAGDAFVARLDGATGALQWNTFLGGPGAEAGYGIAVEYGGEAYVVGDSSAHWGAPTSAYKGATDAFAAKLTSGGALVWNTFLGGPGSDFARAVVVDGSAKNLYLAGSSSADWGLAPVRAFNPGSADGFAARILPSTGGLVWHTFLGGSGSDTANAAALDKSGNLYLAGESSQTWGKPLNAFSASMDAYAASLDPNGQLRWNTFLGGKDIDTGAGVWVDDGGAVYVTGTSYVGWGSPSRAFTGGSDAYVARLTTGGNQAGLFFIGSSRNDYGTAIRTGISGQVYLAGASTAPWGSPVKAYSDGWDGFIARIDPAIRQALYIPIVIR